MFDPVTDPTGPALTCVGLAGLLLAESYKSRPLVWLFKPLASTGFLLTATTSPGASTSFGRTLISSLALSFAGDVLLIPQSPACFQAGLFAFLLGHVGFAIGFARRGLDPQWTLGALAGCSAAAVMVWKWLSPHLPSRDKIPVALYTGVISLMTAAAIGSAPYAPSPGRQIAGAMIFQLSDLCVAREQFVTKTIANPLVGLPLYYAAQQLIASLLWD